MDKLEFNCIAKFQIFLIGPNFTISNAAENVNHKEKAASFVMA